MFAAFLGGWEIMLLLAIAGVIGLLFVAALVVVLLVNLPKLRRGGHPTTPQSVTQPSAQ